jgi:ABC-type Zn uptake system ZnuABC Zn-binding protein ZnuA
MNKKRKYVIIVTLLFEFLLVIGTNNLNTNYTTHNIKSEPIPSQSSLNVMTSISIPADLVKNILGVHGTVESIVGGGVDIHTFQGPTAIQKQRMTQADLFVAMGVVDLEPWLEDTLISLGSDAPKVIYLVQQSMMYTDPLINDLNPHVWMDPTNVKIMVSNITTELIDIDSANSASYLANNNTYQAILDVLNSNIEGNRTGGYLVGGYQDLKIVVNHPAFFYLFDRLGINQTSVIERFEGQEPSPSYINQIILNMTRDNVRLIVSTPQASQQAVNSIARAASSKIIMATDLLYVTGINGEYIDTYVKMIEYNLWALANPIDPPADIAGYDFLLIGISIIISISISSTIMRKKGVIR